jgi:hopanoid biosynthesis associated RND transporter like protein HpnN
LKEPAGLVAKLLAWWVRRVAEHPWLTLALAVAVTALGTIYTLETISINTDTTEMIDPHLPYRIASEQYSADFSPQNSAIVVAVEAEIPEAADAKAEWLATALEDEPGIEAVFRPDGGPFLARESLLLLPKPDLAALTDELARAQPLLAVLAADPTAGTLFGLLGQTLERADNPKDLIALRPMIGALIPAIESALAGEARPFSWVGLVPLADGVALDRQYLQIRPDLDFGSIAPASRAMDSIRATIGRMPPDLAGAVQVYVTGSAALDDDELAAATQGVASASIISLTVVGLLLFWSVRSVWLALAALITLNIGLLWTAAFAALAVGRLNLISLTFAVLFVGLGEDFSIHFALRIREAIDSGRDKISVLSAAVAGAGPALLLCTVGAVVGFCAFVPTAYVGLSELGIIAGAGMFIAFLATLTVMPALLALRTPKLKPLSIGKIGVPIEGFLKRHALKTTILLGLLGLGALATLPRLEFDENPLNLKDQSAPSVVAFRHLAQSDPNFSYPAEVVAPSLAEADALAERLARLPDIHRVTTLSSFLPEDQEAKLAMLEDLQFLMLPVLDAELAPPPSDPRLSEAARSLADRLARPIAGLPADFAAELDRLRALLLELAASDPAARTRFQTDLFRHFPKLVERLATALEAEPITLESLPPELKRRWLAPTGHARVEAISTEDVVHDPVALERFVDAVQSLAPHATGDAVGLVEGGRAVTKAMTQAGLIALAGMLLLLAVWLRNLADMLYILVPVLLAGLLTLATSILVGHPLNFANVIALPLLFGLGVASGIHFVMRAREEPAGADLFLTSTPRASLFSTLTTIFSFSSLAVSDHRGIESMGILLAIAILWTLVATLVLLPALFELADRRRRRNPA